MAVYGWASVVQVDENLGGWDFVPSQNLTESSLCKRTYHLSTSTSTSIPQLSSDYIISFAKPSFLFSINSWTSRA